MGQLQVEYRPA